MSEVMRARGYPAADLDRRLADVAVGQPGLVDPDRSACDIAGRAREGQASTEDLPQALVHYRALFDALLAVREPEPAPMTRAMCESPLDHSAPGRVVSFSTCAARRTT